MISQEELNNIFIKAITNNNISLAQHYINQGADIHALNDWALRHCAKDGVLEATQFLLSQGADVHALNDWALNQASKKGRLQVVQLLIDNGANIFSRKESVLFNVSQHPKSEALIHTLLDKGLNPSLHKNLLYNVTTLGSVSLVDRLLKKGLSDNIDLLIYITIENDHLPLYQYFNHNNYNNDSNEIHFSIAVEKNALNVAKYLIQKGVLISENNFIKAMNEEHISMAEILFEHAQLTFEIEKNLVNKLVKTIQHRVKGEKFIYLFMKHKIPFKEDIKFLVRTACNMQKWNLLTSLYHYHTNKQEIWKSIKQYAKRDFLEQITHYHQQYLLVNQLEKSLPSQPSSSKNKL